MKGIEIRNGCVFYYGNPAGYVDKGTAVMDNLFRGKALECWIAKRGLVPEWTDGVYDRLSSGGTRMGKTSAPLKSCRIWQLRADVDVMMKFIGYEEMTMRFGEPDAEDYVPVYDGQVETNDLEAIWVKFNNRRPPGYSGHSLSMSDVIELYDHAGSEFHYVDQYGFKQISFDGQEQAQGMNMGM